MRMNDGSQWKKPIPVAEIKPRRELTRKQLKRLTKAGHDDGLEELSNRIGRDKAVAAWNSTAYHGND